MANWPGEGVLVRETEERFLRELRHHFAGWKAKIGEESSKAHFEGELESLRGDPVR